jgi:hypothetical protein
MDRFPLRRLTDGPNCLAATSWGILEQEIVMLAFSVRYVVILVVMASLAFPHGLRAQSPVTSPVRVGFGAGLTFPNGDIAAESTSGVNLLAFATIMPARWPVGFVVDGGYHIFATSGGAKSSRVMSVTGGVVIPVAGTLGDPYIAAGAGYYNTQGPTTGSVDAERDFGAYGGLGIKFTRERFELRVEARVHEIFAEKAADGRSRSRELIPLTFGVVF